MTIIRAIFTLTYLSILTVLSACGGVAEDADAPLAVQAGDSSVDIGEHVVHFSAQTTDQLTPEVARTYNIVRSKNRAMLNVSVLVKGSNEPVEAEVAVKTVNLTGQLKNVVMRKVTEQDAIYYIGETPIANRETLIFDIVVTPEGLSEPSEVVRFRRQFYSN